MWQVKSKIMNLILYLSTAPARSRYLSHFISSYPTNSTQASPEIRKIKINSLVQLLIYYRRYHSSLSVLCLLPMGLPCLERLLTDDLSSILIVGDNGIIFLVPLGVGTIHALKLQITTCYPLWIL